MGNVSVSGVIFECERQNLNGVGSRYPRMRNLQIWNANCTPQFYIRGLSIPGF